MGRDRVGEGGGRAEGGRGGGQLRRNNSRFDMQVRTACSSRSENMHAATGTGTDTD